MSLIKVILGFFIIDNVLLQYPYLISNTNSNGNFDVKNDKQNENTDKVIIYYNFKEKNQRNRNNHKIMDYSGTGNDGLLDSGSLILGLNNEKCTTAAYFYGTSLQVFGNTLQERPVDGITVSFWYKNYDPNSFQTLFLMNGPLFGVMSLKVIGSQVFWSAYHYNLVNSFNVAGKGLPKNDWVHLAASYDKLSGRAQIYVNSSPVNRTFSSSPFPVDKPVESIRFGDYEQKYSIHGFLTEIKVYNNAVTYNKILEDFHSCGTEQYRPMFRRDIDENQLETIDKSSNQNDKRSVHETNKNNDYFNFGENNEVIDSLEIIDPF